MAENEKIKTKRQRLGFIFGWRGVLGRLELAEIL